jgi:hypothetical protein
LWHSSKIIIDIHQARPQTALSAVKYSVYPETPKVLLSHSATPNEHVSLFKQKPLNAYTKSSSVQGERLLTRVHLFGSLRLILLALHESGLLMQTSVHRTHNARHRAEHAIKCTNMLINLPCTRGVLTRSRLHRTAQQQQLQTARGASK